MAKNEGGQIATEVVREGRTMVQMEDDKIRAVAQLRPREIKAVQTAVMAEIDVFQENAQQYFYSIPYKSGDGGGSVAVEGPSIVLAETMQRYFGNCAASWQFDQETAGEIWLSGKFVDYETNTIFHKPYRVSKSIKRRNGKVELLREDRLTMAINAGGAKAQRNATIAGIGRPLADLCWQHAKSIIAGPKPEKTIPLSRAKEIGDLFKEFGADLESCERVLGVKAAKWTGNHKATLKGMWQALHDGQTTAEQMFGVQVQKTEAVPVAKPADRFHGTADDIEPISEDEAREIAEAERTDSAKQIQKPEAEPAPAKTSRTTAEVQAQPTAPDEEMPVDLFDE